jgi:enoyl-CoA hydratase/carnithine racemase
VSLEVSDLLGGVRALTLVSAGRRNAIDEETLEQLEKALSDSKDVRCWLVRGSQGHFCSGYDLNALKALEPHEAMPDERLGQVFDALAQQSAPVVAYVEGAAYGAGFELACACDFRIGHATSVFCAPPAKLGIVYAAKGIRRIARVVGLGRARSMFLSGRKVESAEALALGLLDELANEERAIAFCRELADLSPLALAGMKRVLHSLEGGPVSREELADIDQLRRQSFSSEDAKEGRAALLEKRPPKFSGR